MAHEHAHAHEPQWLSPTQILTDEHRVIERMLNSLAKLSVKLADGQTPPEWMLAGATDFIGGFADACHHAKEEKKLFPMLATVGMPPYQGPISVMLSEHEQGRAYNREIRSASALLLSGDESARERLIGAMNGYIQLLRAHIKKEDNALFPMADRVLSEDQQAILLDQFEDVERDEIGEGTHDKYLDVVVRMEEAVAK